MSVRQEAHNRKSKATGQLEVFGKIRPAEISILKFFKSCHKLVKQQVLSAQNSKNQETMQ
jgi:hypothetical protein